MFFEEIIEEGIVISSSNSDKVGTNGYAEVLLNRNDNCKECTLNILCKPKDKDSLTLKVLDPFNTKPGDYIKISVPGNSILKTSFILYGLPLILFLLIIITVYLLTNDNAYSEIISFIAGLSILFLYKLILRRVKAITIIPKIIWVKRREEIERK